MTNNLATPPYISPQLKLRFLQLWQNWLGMGVHESGLEVGTGARSYGIDNLVAPSFDFMIMITYKGLAASRNQEA